MPDEARSYRAEFYVNQRGDCLVDDFYFFHFKSIVLTHAILKKSGPIPREEIERARRFRLDWLDRYGKETL